MALLNPLYYWEPVYTPKEVKEINKNLKKYIMNEDTTRWAAEDVVKTSKVDAIIWKDAKKYLHQFNDFIRLRNARAFGFHLFPENDYDWLFINRYSKGEQYAWHLDSHTYPPSDIKITALLNLSESPYEGGTLEMNTGYIKKAPEMDKPGNMIIFPSFILHRVTPVTKGTRTSLAFLLTGGRWT